MKFTISLCAAGMLGACATPASTSDSETATALTAATTPKLSLVDLFLPFGPGVFHYARDRGSVVDSVELKDFGITHRSFPLSLQVVPFGETPDLKTRARVTLSVAPGAGTPAGDVTVRGQRYFRSATPPYGLVSVADDETLSFTMATTKVTNKYFDEITSIETPGLNLDVVMKTELWNGHEQEIDVGTGIAGVDEMTCEGSWLVHFNGQTAPAQWDPDTGTCGAKLAASGGSRGLYFPVVPDPGANDTYHHFNTDGWRDSRHTWQQWLNGAGAAQMWFDIDEHASNDTRLRPIVILLERVSDGAIVDAARTMTTITIDPYGVPSLVGMRPDVEVPGAIAQLSPRGLDRLEPTHEDTLPYPINPAGTQPRLSERAIDLSVHTSPEVTVRLKDLPDVDYWTKAPTGSQTFAGYLAYQDIKQAARDIYLEYKLLYDGCTSARCKAFYDALYCVKHEPDEGDFRIRIAGVHTYFEKTRPLDALVVGDITHMDLGFGASQILANFLLEHIAGWLHAVLDPADVQLEYSSGFPLCERKPVARKLSEPAFSTGTVDYQHWLDCDGLWFFAQSGTLGDPIKFSVVGAGEDLSTPFASLGVHVSLNNIALSSGHGICGQSWMSPTILDELAAWQPDVEGAIGAELLTSPGEDEALKRLLSPYELGIARVTTPPTGTPAYDVHPLPTYELSAELRKTFSDAHGVHANPTDGLYLPYLTQSSPLAGTDTYPTWFCPRGAGQSCTGLADAHPVMLAGGVDDKNTPYDVSITYTTGHISQALWTQARLADHLGSPSAPARLALTGTEIKKLASALGYTDVVDALAAAGSKFGVRYHQEAAPFVLGTDPAGSSGKLIYATPNVVLELVSIASDGRETVVAKLMADVVDFDHHMTFHTGGVPALDTRWGSRTTPALTTTFLPGCYGSTASVLPSCAEKLALVIGALWVPSVEAMLRDMVAELPTLQLFDAGQESTQPRHLKNVRTQVTDQRVVLLGDLCDPAAVDCD